MADHSHHETSVELLQQLGLKEYEARCFVTLSRLPNGTAKEISEVSDVPRTRVYDAIRVLEAEGLVEVQHSSPQRFRAVPIEEAAETLREEFEDRTERLVESLRNLDAATPGGDDDGSHEVWALSGTAAISNRTEELVDEAQEELLLVVGSEEALTEDLLDGLRSARNRGVSVIVGTVSEPMRDRLREALPESEVFVSGLEWLNEPETDVEDQTTITRLLLVDRSTILVGAVAGGEPSDTGEHAIFGRGFGNGLVVIARRLMATGLSSFVDPGAEAGSLRSDG